MQCPTCGSDNFDSASTCVECGRPLYRSCPSCGSSINANAKFCSECGTSLQDWPQPLAGGTASHFPAHLTEHALSASAVYASRVIKAGERKTISVLFTDLVGSTELIHDLDPEEVRNLIDPVLELMMEAVHHYKGYVAKSLGDGILALFGAPLAYEDHPQRALYAALRMQDAIRRHCNRLAQQRKAERLQIRVGIHTGEVVVRAIRTADLHIDYDPVGQSIHIASRMESIAAPGTIVVSDTTHRLTDGYIAYEALGATPVKGIPQPMPTFRALGQGPLRTRFQVATSRGLAPLVGRRRELEKLGDALDEVLQGRGQIASVVGEPGVGKSRLCYEFKRVAQASCLVLETFSVSHGKAFPYHPLIELLRAYLQISSMDDGQRRQLITDRLVALDPALEDALPYLFYLLGLDNALAQMDPQLRRLHTFGAIQRILQRESLNQPLVVIFEDLQWLDRETEAFLDDFSKGLAGARILLLVNHRPEYRHNWEADTPFTPIRLDPLGQADAAELLDALLGTDPSLNPLRPRLLSQSEGNPFFIEEIVQALVEERMLEGEPGHYRLHLLPAELQIPTSVQGILSTRIDRLTDSDKQLLQTLAVIGKEFPWSLVQQVLNQPETDLHMGLMRLQAGEFIYERAAFPEVEYTFKHGLTQQVAYSSLLREQRSLLHQRTARAIESLFGDHLDEHCDELAYHYSHSDDIDKAVKYLQRAGELAIRQSADRDAVKKLGKALELLPSLPESETRNHRELELLSILVPTLMHVRGSGGPEIESSCRRALELSRQLGETPQRFSALIWLRRHYLQLPDFATALELGELLLDRAKRMEQDDFLLEALLSLGPVHFYRGEFAASQNDFEQLLSRYDPNRHKSHALRFGVAPDVMARTLLACSLWFQGRPFAALTVCQRMLQRAEELSHPYTLALALEFAAELHQLRGDTPRALELAEASIALSSEKSFPYWQSKATVIRGWARGQQGQLEEAVTMIRKGLDECEQRGTHLGTSYHLALLAESLARAGQIEAGLEALDRARAFMDKSGERYFDAEIHRLKGNLMLEQAERSASARQNEAEACFQQAIEIARNQGACSLELRAATSLARLWQQQGRKTEARDRLQAVYAGFDEGFETADLVSARSLLNTLAQN